MNWPYNFFKLGKIGVITDQAPNGDADWCAAEGPPEGSSRHVLDAVHGDCDDGDDPYPKGTGRDIVDTPLGQRSQTQSQLTLACMVCDWDGQFGPVPTRPDRNDTEDDADERPLDPGCTGYPSPSKRVPKPDADSMCGIDVDDYIEVPHATIAFGSYLSVPQQNAAGCQMGS